MRLVTTRLYENEAIQWRYTGIPFSLRRPYRTFKHQHSPSHRTRQTVGAVASPRCRCFASSCPGRCAASEACGARRPRGLRTTCEIMKNPINWLENLTNNHRKATQYELTSPILTSSNVKHAYIGGSSSESNQVVIFHQYCTQMYFNKNHLIFMAMSIHLSHALFIKYLWYQVQNNIYICYNSLYF